MEASRNAQTILLNTCIMANKFYEKILLYVLTFGPSIRLLSLNFPSVFSTVFTCIYKSHVMLM